MTTPHHDPHDPHDGVPAVPVDEARAAEFAARFPHLAPNVAAVMDEGDDVRRTWIQRGCFIPYHGVTEALARAEALAQVPRRVRMPWLTLLAPPNAGKSSLLAEVERRHPVDVNLPGGVTRARVT
ncbi:TniB family NTP-binding protein, partial [Deinococcus pimensis]|uniref:TniB family NTP-binding protein n=1 Tax=Deinococcus pimensis TaxID=309888 RepID=UPI0005EB9991